MDPQVALRLCSFQILLTISFCKNEAWFQGHSDATLVQSFSSLRWPRLRLRRAATVRHDLNHVTRSSLSLISPPLGPPQLAGTNGNVPNRSRCARGRPELGTRGSPIWSPPDI
eukprot:3215207-Pyramimonas_sp.AAC.2